MKKTFLVFIILMLLSTFTVLAEGEERRVEEIISLPGTYTDSEVHIMDTQDELMERLRTGWDNLSETIDVSDLKIPFEDRVEIYTDAIYNNPLYYYVGQSVGFSYIGKYIVEIHPTYDEYDRSVIEETIEQINDARDEILLYVNDNMTDFEKIMAVHDYMVLNYCYDESFANHDITIMTTKTGVCMSYTLAFKYLMDTLGIECTYVSSESMNHAWNLVKLDGKWYHIDLTWDDPTHDKFAQVRHTYELLSTDKIKSLENPHYGFDTNGLRADSTLYDDAVWHNNTASIVCLDDMEYWIEDNSVVREDGTVIYNNLSGTDKDWNIGFGYCIRNTVFAGLAEYNGLLYFNTDEAIYSYNPHTDEIKTVLKEEGVCGLYIDKNNLSYSKYNINNNYIEYAQSIHLGDVKIASAYVKDDKIITKIFKEDTDEDIQIFSSGANGCHVETITDSGITTAEFDVTENQVLFFWDSNMRPLREKEIIN